MVAQVNRSIMHPVQIVQGVSNAPYAYRSLVQWFDCINFVRAIDPCCGSGSFLVRAMTQALDDCSTAIEQEEIKKHKIFGIEFDENVYGDVCSK